MKENVPDTFSTEEVTISVNAKPKYYYPSSATNWANDLYKDRLAFPEEHEIQGTGTFSYYNQI